MRIGLTTVVDRPIEDVFAYVTNPGNLAEWQPNVVSVSNETGGPIGVGTRFREVRRGPLGRTVEALVEVAEYEPPRRFDLRILSGPLPVHAANEFQRADAGTRIEFVAHGELRGILRFAEPILARLLRRQFAADYERLKERLESSLPLRHCEGLTR
jgi:carbon monoxide dehydrogenase subunit G